MYCVSPLSMVDDRRRVVSEAETILFANAVTQDFASEQARADYRKLWFGRYIDHFPDEFFVVLDDGGSVLGYLAGSLVSNRPPLPGPDYYAQLSANLIVEHPAHIHVNIRGDVRGEGLGSHLVEAFAVHSHERRCNGFHAVTALDSSAPRFFRSCRMKDLAEIMWNGRKLLMLGRKSS